jgi:hypothetical protein
MGAKKGNKNAEVWTLKEAQELFDEALALSTGDDYDFIGEIARDLGTYREIFVYLTAKFPVLEEHYNRILSNLEANCFSHIKRGKIREASGIMNLKSNFKWTDRQDHTVSGGIELHFDKDDSKA